MSRPLKVFSLLAVSVAVLVAGYFAIWAFFGLAIRIEPSKVEVVRASSPSGAIEAVVLETNGEAATSFGYIVAVVSPGEQADSTHEVAYLYGARRSDSSYGVNVRWHDSDELMIEYLDARQTEVFQPTFTLGDEDIRVSLASGISDRLAPPGGMLYDLGRTQR
jgi:hypothetical protein